MEFNQRFISAATILKSRYEPSYNSSTNEFSFILAGAKLHKEKLIQVWNMLETIDDAGFLTRYGVTRIDDDTYGGVDTLIKVNPFFVSVDGKRTANIGAYLDIDDYRDILEFCPQAVSFVDPPEFIVGSKVIIGTIGSISSDIIELSANMDCLSAEKDEYFSLLFQPKTIQRNMWGGEYILVRVSNIETMDIFSDSIKHLKIEKIPDMLMNWYSMKKFMRAIIAAEKFGSTYA